MPKEFVPSDWITHEHTERLRKEWSDRKRQALIELLSEAKSSQDPDVRAAYAEYVQCERFLAQLKGGDLQRSDDVHERDAAAEAED